MSSDATVPHTSVSAYELGQMLGDALPTVESVSAGQLALAEAARALLDAVVRTTVDDAARERSAADLRRITSELLATADTDVVRLVRHPGGRIENLIQAAAGRANPRSLRLTFDDMTPPPEGVVHPDATAVGRVVLDASASGPPGRAHGGIVTTILDEALGVAIMRAGRTGMTVAIDVSFLGAVPIGADLVVHARCTVLDGRKTTAEAELCVDGRVAARARGLFVARRPAG